MGRYLTGAMVSILEAIKYVIQNVLHLEFPNLICFRLAPKGTSRTSNLLQETAYDLVKGGELGIFTPSYFFVARKPDSK